MIILSLGIVFVLASAAVLGFAAFRYRQIIRVNSFFTKAATVYVLVGEEDARLAATAAGKGAAAKDRQRMQEFLSTLSDSFRAQPAAAKWNHQIERANKLSQELARGGALSTEAFEIRDALRRSNDAYFRARSEPAMPAFSCAATRSCSGWMQTGPSRRAEHPDEVAEGMVGEMQGETAEGAAEGTAARGIRSWYLSPAPRSKPMFGATSTALA